jgi:hypothetical protein
LQLFQHSQILLVVFLRPRPRSASHCEIDILRRACRLKQSRQKPVKGNLTAQTLQVNTFLPGNILKPVLKCSSKGCACRDSEVLTQNQILKKQVQKIFHFNVTLTKYRVSPNARETRSADPCRKSDFEVVLS